MNGNAARAGALAIAMAVVCAFAHTAAAKAPSVRLDTGAGGTDPEVVVGANGAARIAWIAPDGGLQRCNLAFAASGCASRPAVPAMPADTNGVAAKAGELELLPDPAGGFFALARQVGAGVSGTLRIRDNSTLTSGWARIGTVGLDEGGALRRIFQEERFITASRGALSASQSYETIQNSANSITLDPAGGIVRSALGASVGPLLVHDEGGRVTFRRYTGPSPSSSNANYHSGANWTGRQVIADPAGALVGVALFYVVDAGVGPGSPFRVWRLNAGAQTFTRMADVPGTENATADAAVFLTDSFELLVAWRNEGESPIFFTGSTDPAAGWGGPVSVTEPQTDQRNLEIGADGGRGVVVYQRGNEIRQATLVANDPEPVKVTETNAAPPQQPPAAQPPVDPPLNPPEVPRRSRLRAAAERNLGTLKGGVLVPDSCVKVGERLRLQVRFADRANLPRRQKKRRYKPKLVRVSVSGRLQSNEKLAPFGGNYRHAGKPGGNATVRVYALIKRKSKKKLGGPKRLTWRVTLRVPVCRS